MNSRASILEREKLGGQKRSRSQTWATKTNLVQRGIIRFQNSSGPGLRGCIRTPCLLFFFPSEKYLENLVRRMVIEWGFFFAWSGVRGCSLVKDGTETGQSIRSRVASSLGEGSMAGPDQTRGHLSRQGDLYCRCSYTFLLFGEGKSSSSSSLCMTVPC